MIRVAVAGAAGRMGQTVCAAVRGAEDMELVGEADPLLGSALADYLADADVVVDFTTPDTALPNALECLQAGVHVVIGTTGFDPAPLERSAPDRDPADGDPDHPRANVLIAPNFAIGAILMMRFAAEAARHMAKAEIIELHHDNKVDAPSGTALHIAKLIADSRTRSTGTPFSADPTTVQTVEGTRGGEAPGGVRVHSIRLPGLVAHHEIIFGAVGQTLAIRHDAFDRTSFMPGVLLAVRSVVGADGLTIGLGPLLGF